MSQMNIRASASKMNIRILVSGYFFDGDNLCCDLCQQHNRCQQISAIQKLCTASTNYISMHLCCAVLQCNFGAMHLCCLLWQAFYCMHQLQCIAMQPLPTIIWCLIILAHAPIVVYCNASLLHLCCIGVTSAATGYCMHQLHCIAMKCTLHLDELLNAVLLKSSALLKLCSNVLKCTLYSIAEENSTHCTSSLLHSGLTYTALQDGLHCCKCWQEVKVKVIRSNISIIHL